MKRLLLIVGLVITGFHALAQWSALTGPPGGRIDHIRINGATTYAVSLSDYKIYTSTNDGTSWTKIVPASPTNLSVYDLLVDGGNLIITDYSNIWKSVDNGLNWTRITDYGEVYSQNLYKIAANTYAAYGYYGVYITTDGGLNWTQITTTWTLDVVANASGDLFFVSYDASGGIYRHLDPANVANPVVGSWSSSNVSSVYPSSYDYYMRLGVAGTAIFAMTGSSDIKRSLLNGELGSWVSATTGIAETGFNGIFALSPSGLYFVNNSYSKVYYTSAPAAVSISWTTLATGAFPSSGYSGSAVYDLKFRSSPTFAAFAGTYSDGVFLSTTDPVATWTLASNGIYAANGTDIEFASYGGTDRIFYKTGYSKGYWYSDSPYTDWSFNNSATFTDSFQKVLKLPTSGFNGNLLTYGGKVYYSTDASNGAAWTSVTTGISYLSDITYNANYTAGATYLYGISGSPYYSADNGVTWATLSLPVNPAAGSLPSSYNISQIALDNAGRLFVRLYNYTTSKNEVWKITLSSATAGVAAQLSPPLTDDEENYNYFSGFFVNNNKLYYGTQNNVYLTSDQGTNWTTTSFSHNALISIQGGICASASGSLFVTQDDGDSWSNFSLPSDAAIISDITVGTSGVFYAAASSSPALKNTSALISGSPPVYIDFNWQAINGPYGASAIKTVVDNSLNTYVFANSSLFKTSNFASWSSISLNAGAGYGINDIAVDNSSNKIFALTWGELLTSTDGGDNWTAIPNESITNRYIMRRSANGDLVMATSRYIYISTDGGTTFGSPKYDMGTNSNVYGLEVTSNNVIFLRYYDYDTDEFHFVKSADGNTWTEVTTLPETSFNTFSVHPTDGSIFLSTYNDIYRSVDNGDTWSSIKGDFASYFNYDSKIYVKPDSPNEYYFSNSSFIYQSTNGGTNWVEKGGVSEPSNIYNINWNGTRMILSTYSGIYTSDDSGLTLVERNTGIPPTNSDLLELTAPSKLYVRAGGNEYNSDDLQNWIKFTDIDISGFYHKPDGSLLAYNYNTIYSTPDGGETWTEVGSFSNGLYGIATADNTNYYAISYNEVYFSSDLTNWSLINVSGLPASGSRYMIGIEVDASGTFYLILSNYTNNTTEAYQVLFGSGVKINQITNPIDIHFHQNKIKIFDSDSYSKGAIFESTDGSSWIKKACPAGTKLIIAEKDYYFIPSYYNGKLWLSRDVGQTWQSVGLNSQTSTYQFTDVVINEYNGYAYAAVTNSPVRKSGNIVFPPETTAPVISTFSPADGASGVSLSPTLTMTFDEPVSPVALKTVKLIDANPPYNAIEIINADAGVQNGKSFSYTLSAPLLFNKSYFVTVDVSTGGPPATDGSFKDIFDNYYAGFNNQTTWNFTTRSAPTVATLAPTNSATNIATNTSLVVTFTEALTPVASKKLTIYKTSAPTTEVMSVDATSGAPSGNTLTYALPLPLEFNTQYFAKFDAGSFTTVDDGTVTILTNNTDWVFTTRPAPTLSILTPSNNATNVNLNSNLIITFSEPMTGASGTYVKIYKVSDPATAVLTIEANSGALSGSSLTYTLPSPLEFNTAYFVQADANAFKAADDGTISVITNTTDWEITTRMAPTVSSTLPANAATGISLTSQLSVTFSETVQLVSGKMLYIASEIEPGTPVYSFDVTGGTTSGSTATFDLPGALQYSTSYIVTFDEGAFISSDGGSLNVFTSSGWQFTTRSAPTIASTSPSNATVDVPLSTSLSITFSEDVQFVASKNLYVTEVGQTAPVATIALSTGAISGATATFSLPNPSPLSYLTSYFVTADPDAFETSNNVPFSLLTANSDWTFTTIETPDTEAPVISYTPIVIQKGGSNNFQTTINDNKSVASASLWYRSITSSGTYTETALTFNSSQNKWEVAVDDSWLDGMGLEYFFTAKDPSNNLGRLPADPNVFSSNLSFSTPPSVTNGIISFGGEADNYRIISIPYNLTDNKVSIVFNEINNGQPDKTKWRLLTLGTGTNWLEYSNGFTTIDKGKGYWINVRNQISSLQIEGASTPDFDRFNLFPMMLKAGWNQIGNPYTQDISWNEIKTQNTNIGVLKTYNGTSYSNGDILKPFEGGFVFVNGSSQVTVDITFKGIPVGGRTKQDDVIEGSDLSSDTWLVPIFIGQDDFTNEFSGIGMSTNADRSFDQFDDVNVPRFVRFLEMNFGHPEHALGSFARDVVPTNSEHVWEFSVASNLTGFVKMEWDNSGFGENDNDLYLFDRGLQAAVNMREVNSYTFDASRSSEFRIYFGKEARNNIKPDFITLGEAYPNPSAENAVIPFSLPEQNAKYNVRMDVFDLMGKKIVTLVNGERPSGFHQATWDHRDSNLSNGFYTYRLSVSGDNVQEVLSGKLILRK